MSQPERHTTGAPISSPRVAPIRVTCPHCGNPLDVVPMLVTPSSTHTHPSEEAESPAARISRAALNAIQHRLFPFSAAVEDPHEQDGSATESSTSRSSRSWRMVLLVVLGTALIGVLLIWLGQPAGVPARTSLPSVIPAATSAPPSASTRNLSADEAAILDTLTRYNSAESEAAALLTTEPLRSFMDPNGAFAQRRIAQLAERQRRNAPHRTILVRWAVGQIRVEGMTATVVTQETWSNQEAGAVAPEQAPVRVTYTLRWDGTAGRWLIMESEQGEL